MRRVVASLSLLALLFAGSAESAGLHRCPHHDMLPSAAGDHSGRSAGHAADSGSPAHHPCTCMGACHPAGVATPVQPGAITLVLDGEGLHAADGWSPQAPRAMHTPFALPPSNGPPVD